MPTTRNIKARSVSNISSPSIPSPASPQPNPPSPMSAQPNPREATAESPNEFDSLPPRMRLKEKRKHFGEFRIIREPTAAIQHHTTEFKPIPSPPWAKDPDAFHRLDNDTRGKESSHAHTSFPSNATPSPPHQKDDTSSDAGPSLGISYHLRPHRTIKPRPQTISNHTKKERAQSVPDEDEDKITMATAALEQLQHSGTQSNTFPPPARPSRKQKRYECDICGQIFTRSGDVRRHQESRHHNSEGCRCPFCDRVLTRQDALQRHWDKYCRKKSKRHLDKQASETPDRTVSSVPIPLYALGTLTQTTSTTATTTATTRTGLDQTQYRYLNIFG